MSEEMKKFGIRGAVFDFVANPRQSSKAFRFFEDAIMVISDGRVESIAQTKECLDTFQEQYPILEYPGCFICPGFIDTHIHYAQTRIIGSPAPGLLEWLETYTFPEELRFSDPNHSAAVASQFFDELVSNGTTCAQVYPTVHENSTDLFFEEAHSRGLRMVAGKVLMDRHAPEGLLDGNDGGEAETERLIKKWHGKGRQSYSITLRFAATSTLKQMEVCRRLVQRYPDLLFHTHLAETLPENEWTMQLYPDCSDYLGVYEKFGVVSDHSVFAHCIHLSDSEKQRMADAGTSIALCPTSNSFLGSGLVPLNQLDDYHIGLSLGTDVGGGTSFSMLKTMQEMYKIVSLGGDRKVDELDLFYLATLGGARALKIDEHVGSLEIGKEADFVILDDGGQRLIQQRFEQSQSISEKLFALIILGDAANIRETWCMGRRVYRRGVH